MPVQTPKILQQSRAAEQKDTPWNVVVSDDPVNLMEYVTLVFRRVFGYNREKATDLMLQVHNRGRSIVWSGNREKAEFYVQQLHTCQLRTTLEKKS